MEWIQIAGAVGFGAIATKLLDIIWLQNSLRESERRKWLREKRFEVYSDLTSELLSLGKNGDLREDAFKGYAMASKAILLTENDELADDIEKFFTWLFNLFKEATIPVNHKNKKSEEELEGAYEQVYKESRRLVKELRKSLHKI